MPQQNNTKKEIEQIRENLYMMTEMFNKIKDGIYITDEKGTTIYVNDTFIDLSGLRKEDLIGKNVYKLNTTNVLPNSCCAKVIETGKPVDTINNYYEGQRCLVSGSPIYDANGQLKRTIAVIRDVSELDFLMKRVSEAENKVKSIGSDYVDDSDGHESDSQNVVMNHIYEQAKKIADVDTTILILGETGVGKDHLAEYIHEASDKANQGKLIKINCGAIPEHLLESELYGYEDGAFTGAKKGGKKGLFEEAAGGTLYLDEIGDMPYMLQVKLLNVLNDQYFYKIGGTQKVKFTGRIIAATNSDLERLVEDRKFRKDLFYRLNVVSFDVPPLRNRREDILQIARQYIAYYNEYFGRQCYLSKDSVDLMIVYNWPGNIRELKNIIERTILMTDKDLIDTTDLLSCMKDEESIEHVETVESTLKERLANYEKFIIQEVLVKSNTLGEAAKRLGIDISTLVRKKKRLGI